MRVRHSIMLGEGIQTIEDDSFVGGRPKLPRGIALPVCAICESALTFYFQVAFPIGHAWGGQSLAVFACANCADQNSLIPEMLTSELKDADVSEEFLETYQRNFRIFAFATANAEPVASYSERVRFRDMQLIPNGASSFGHIGGDPDWLGEDETPQSIGGFKVTFLMQLSSALEFETVPDAPGQIELGLDGSPRVSPDNLYRLFIGNAVYIFGALPPSPDLLYVLTQV